MLEVRPGDLAKVQAALAGLSCTRLGVVNTSGTLGWTSVGVKLGVDELAKAWMGTLDW